MRLAFNGGRASESIQECVEWRRGGSPQRKEEQDHRPAEICLPLLSAQSVEAPPQSYVFGRRLGGDSSIKVSINGETHDLTIHQENICIESTRYPSNATGAIYVSKLRRSLHSTFGANRPAISGLDRPPVRV
jgi:hypothetical protein